MTRRAVIYARVSTEDQAKHGYSLPSQLEGCRKYAEERGWIIVEEVADEGVSGATLDRPGLDCIRDMAEAGEIDTLVVYEMDRLSRKVAHQLILEEEFAKAGVQVHYVLGDYEDTDEGRLMKTIRAAIGEYERGKIRERANRGKRQKARSGKVLVFARPPYGYRQEDGMLVPYEPEARVVRLIFNWYVKEHLPIRTIVRKLNDLGAPTAGDRRDSGGIVKRQGYGRWGRSTVSKILNNETYAGGHYQKWRREGKKKRRRPREEWIDVQVPPIIDRAMWEAAQERRRLNKEQARRNRKHRYLLCGKGICGLCGARMYSYPSHGRLFYRCSRKRGEVLGERCNAPSFSAKHVDNAVWNYVRSLLLDPVSLIEGLKAQQVEREKANTPLRDRLAIVDDLLTDHRAKLARLLDLYLAGDFPQEMLTDRKTKLETTIQSLEREKADLQARLEAATITDEQIRAVDEFAQCIQAGLQEAGQSFEAKRRILDLLDVRATLTVEDGEKVIYVRCLIDSKRLSIVPITSEHCDPPPPPLPAPASHAPAL